MQCRLGDLWTGWIPDWTEEQGHLATAVIAGSISPAMRPAWQLFPRV